MTTLLATEPFTVDDEINSLICSKNRKRRHILKSKENTYNHKCTKVLKRKLKKYKLRQDGEEDQDVLDVSKILISSLVIKSPNSENKPIIIESEFGELRPKNYLFKMVRKKESVKISDSIKNSNTEVNIQDVTISIPLAVTGQEKKQTNAFKLLMDSRNKSLGSNSPGKEKNNENSDTEEVVERKNIKAKRNLLLQKMAEAKGSLRNKEIEEYQDNIIKKQLEKRAERLKSMILKDNAVKGNEKSKEPVSKESVDPKKPKDKAEVTNNNNTKKKAKTLKIVDIFNTIEDPINISPVKKFISKEDQEFLKKLSPSLKKKESMLCYFKKVDRDSDTSPTNTENDNVIKVKLQTRNKRRGKKKKLSLKKEPVESEDMIDIVEENSQDKTRNMIQEEKMNKVNGLSLNEKGIVEVENVPNSHVPEAVLVEELTSCNDVLVEATLAKSDRQKRKRTFKRDVKPIESEDTILNNDSRPKRSVKRPVKYVDDAGLSSSDEELHIFTPKKKKHIDSTVSDKKPVNTKSDQTSDEPVKSKTQKKEEKALKEKVVPKKPAKLAPIFTPKQSDPAALEAKQKFLQSGVPDKLKKIIQQQKISSIPDISFPVVVHVQQCNQLEENKLAVNIPLMNVTDETCPLYYEKDAFRKLLSLNQAVHSYCIDTNQKRSTQKMLQIIKQLHPKFPVYRTYRYLRGKARGEFKDCNYVDVDNSIEMIGDMADVTNDSPDRLNWTDKYKAMSTSQIIGNFETIKELRKWLISWTENNVKYKAKSKPGSDSSDYYQSDTDSRESMKSMNNLLILTGPTGCGKTASIYAVASDLSMKVIEVNSSSKRTGKIMLQDLQEATQSHKVNRGTGNTENSQKSQEKSQPDLTIKIKKRGRPKKSLEEKTKKEVGKTEVLSGTSSGPSYSQESTRTDSSLILIDDADIVFDQDDGFTSAIVQLVQSSKRPVILITSTLVCPHLQRFLQNGKILKMYPLLPRMLGTWLDIMCLADSGTCWPGAGAKFLNYYKGDIRKTINYLQFCIPSYVNGLASEDESASQNVDLYKANIDEENSCMSWADNDDSERRTGASVDPNVNLETNTIWNDFADKHTNLLDVTYPEQIFNIWWSMPCLLTPENKSDDSPPSKKNVSLELEAMANAADALSLSDYISHNNQDSNTNIASDPWCFPEGHSVSERENLDSYHSEYEVTNEICQTMVTSSIVTAQDVLGCDRNTNIHFPGMSLQRQRDRVVTRHSSVTSYLNASAVLDRRALALDYWSSCRTICRLEKNKNDTNMKRNNRFCHYLKSLSILCKSDTFDNLCDSLCSNEGTKLNINNFNE
uniref:ATPase AAA-type core domain-containing protein n=1 Tax=Heliothis virescens TaxID=7102 RepID=A0A2A4K5A4_HELVI